MTDLKRYGAYVGAPIHDDTSVYLCEDVDALLSERDRREGELRVEMERLKQHYDAAGPEHNLLALLDLYDEQRAAAESELAALRAQNEQLWQNNHEQLASRERDHAELATLRQQLREMTEWRPMETCPAKTKVRLLVSRGVDAPPVVVHNTWVPELLRGGPGLYGADCLGWLPLPPLPKEVERG